METKKGECSECGAEVQTTEATEKSPYWSPICEDCVEEAFMNAAGLSDAPSGKTVMVATCENDDCDDDSRFPLEDGDSMEPARCSCCEEPYTIRDAPSGDGERGG